MKLSLKKVALGVGLATALSIGGFASKKFFISKKPESELSHERIAECTGGIKLYKPGTYETREKAIKAAIKCSPTMQKLIKKGIISSKIYVDIRRTYNDDQADVIHKVNLWGSRALPTSKRSKAALKDYLAKVEEKIKKLPKKKRRRLLKLLEDVRYSSLRMNDDYLAQNHKAAFAGTHEHKLYGFRVPLPIFLSDPLFNKGYQNVTSIDGLVLAVEHLAFHAMNKYYGMDFGEYGITTTSIIERRNYKELLKYYILEEIDEFKATHDMLKMLLEDYLRVGGLQVLPSAFQKHAMAYAYRFDSYLGKGRGGQVKEMVELLNKIEPYFLDLTAKISPDETTVTLTLTTNGQKKTFILPYDFNISDSAAEKCFDNGFKLENLGQCEDIIELNPAPGDKWMFLKY